MQFWVTAVRLGMKGRAYRGRYLEVFYEDLCRRPLETTAAVFELPSSVPPSSPVLGPGQRFDQSSGQVEAGRDRVARCHRHRRAAAAPSSATSRRVTPQMALCAVAPLLSATVLIYFGLHQQLGYDSFWHVLIARGRTNGRSSGSRWPTTHTRRSRPRAQGRRPDRHEPARLSTPVHCRHRRRHCADVSDRAPGGRTSMAGGDGRAGVRVVVQRHRCRAGHGEPGQIEGHETVVHHVPAESAVGTQSQHALYAASLGQGMFHLDVAGTNPPIVFIDEPSAPYPFDASASPLAVSATVLDDGAPKATTMFWSTSAATLGAGALGVHWTASVPHEPG